MNVKILLIRIWFLGLALIFQFGFIQALGFEESIKTKEERNVDPQLFMEVDKKEQAESAYIEIVIQEIAISGKVTSAENGEGLPGVNILVKGTTQGTITDVQGDYRMDVPDENSVLVFSSVGFLQQEIVVGNQTVIDLSMTLDIVSLDQIVVIGYGTQRKQELTGAVSRIEGNQFENLPTSRIDQVLQGRATGVHVSNTSGAPGAAPTIRIRGGNSIQGDNEPLWVIDGIIVGGNFNLNNINNNDIESIDVLKDAVAIAIYGNRGANGVILVTTKNGSGSAGSHEVSVNVSGGIQSSLVDTDFLSGPDHAQYANDDATFRGAAIPFSDPLNVPDINWFDQVTQVAPVYSADISLSGTSQNGNLNYFISGSYFNQEGVVRGSGISKYIFRANFDYKLSEIVKTGFRLNVSRLNQANAKVNISGDIYTNGIPVRDIYDENGQFTQENPVSASISRNPEADIQLKQNEGLTTNILGSIYLDITPVKNLVIRSTISPTLNSFKLNEFNPGALPENAAIGAGGDARVSTISGVGFINENTITYKTDIKTHSSLTALGGVTFQKFTQEEAASQAFQFSNDITGFNNLGFGSNPGRNVVSSGYNGFQLVSFLGRLNYVFRERYLFTVVGRVDGSSRFADDNKYAFFPSAAIGWRLSEEPFIQNLNVFDNLKLRVSYGSSGSQAIPSYRTLALMVNANTTFNEVEQAGVNLGRPSNPALKWETTTQLDIGLEAAFFKGRLSFELDYYRKKTEDLLLNVQIPRQTGFVSKLQNLGEIQNHGFELMINTININKDNFQWSTTLTLSANRNEVVDLGGVDFINLVASSGQGGPSGRLIVGETAPIITGVNYLGTWKSQEEIDAEGIGGDHDVGGIRFEDQNGDKQITEDDFIVLGSPQPDFYFGFGNTLSYKNWELDFFFQGTYGNEIFNSFTQAGFFGRSERNKYKETLDRWTPENPDSDIPAAGTVASLSEILANSEQVEDASHIRLKTLRLAYNIPVNKGIKGLTIYFTGINVFVLSNFRFKDPETNQFGRNNLLSGFTAGEYPSARTMSFGVKAVF